MDRKDFRHDVVPQAVRERPSGEKCNAYTAHDVDKI